MVGAVILVGAGCATTGPVAELGVVRGEPVVQADLFNAPRVSEAWGDVLGGSALGAPVRAIKALGVTAAETVAVPVRTAQQHPKVSTATLFTGLTLLADEQGWFGNPDGLDGFGLFGGDSGGSSSSSKSVPEAVDAYLDATVTPEGSRLTVKDPPPAEVVEAEVTMERISLRYGPFEE